MEDKIESIIRRSRKGDKIEVDRLSELAENMRKLQDRLTRIHKRGACVIDKEGRRSDTPDVADMVFEASAELKKGPPAKVSRENAKKSEGRPPKERETSEEQAKRNWSDLQFKTDKEAIEASPGWNKSVMYYQFGPSGRARGGARPRKRKSS